MRRGVGHTPLPWLGALLVLYLAVPLGAFALRFIHSPTSGFGASGLASAFYVSVLSATLSLVLVASLGIPLAYVLSRSQGRLAAVVGVVIQLPLALPPLMSGILLIYIVGPYTTLGRFFGGRLTESLAGIVLAQSFVAAPFLVVIVRAAFSTIDPGLLDVAATLGHSELSRFWKVAVPVALPGIRAGMLLAWLRAFGEYGAVVIVAYHPFTVPVYTFNQFSATGLPNTTAPTALSLVVAAFGVLLSRVHRGKRRQAAIVPDAQKRPAMDAPAPPTFGIDHHVGGFHLTLAHSAGAATLAILGASGSGKSLLLRCLAGLYGPAPGTVHYGDVPVDRIGVERRRVGYVAQGFSLYPHFTVWQQLLFAPGATPPLAAYWLSRMHLEGLENRYPHQLSGGQRQRTALAQALCRSPILLLLDEPFSGLDAPVRRQLQREVRRLQHETGLATVLVTHDPEEAALLADEVIVISEGHALQSGPTRAVFSQPASPEIAALLGYRNIHAATVASRGWIEADGVMIPVKPTDSEPGLPVSWSIRPEHVSLVREGGVPAVVTDVAQIGGGMIIFVALTESIELEVRAMDQLDLSIGEQVLIHLPPQSITVWPNASLLDLSDTAIV